MKILITGGFGFLGWHVACRLRAMHDVEVVRLGRSGFASSLPEALADADVVLHLAGVNRSPDEELVCRGNVELATVLALAMEHSGRPTRVVFANSVQSGLDNAYGRGKTEAARVLSAAAERVGGSFVDVVLPNLFGEHGRPHYNSFVATFVHQLSRGETPTVEEDKAVSLLHVQDAAAALIEAAHGLESGVVTPTGTQHTVSDVLEMLRDIQVLYSRGEIPDLSTGFTRDLFNTYRAAVFPDAFPMFPQVHRDSRGALFEAARSHGGQGQTFVSTTNPGHTRGEHYHLKKVERFAVVKGEAEIALRRLLTDEVVRFRISGDAPAFVDMPTLWVHNLRNVGSGELVTIFWSDQLLVPDKIDQYPEMVGETA